MKEELLTRQMIETGELDAMIARDAPTLRILTGVEREVSLRKILDTRPEGEAWLFGYGSLIWNPTVATKERRVAQVEGWHRSFCLSIVAGRGSANSPGLVL
jgi:cation transport protein ChaC